MSQNQKGKLSQSHTTLGYGTDLQYLSHDKSDHDALQMLLGCLKINMLAPTMHLSGVAEAGLGRGTCPQGRVAVSYHFCWEGDDSRKTGLPTHPQLARLQMELFSKAMAETGKGR